MMNGPKRSTLLLSIVLSAAVSAGCQAQEHAGPPHETSAPSAPATATGTADHANADNGPPHGGDSGSSCDVDGTPFPDFPAVTVEDDVVAALRAGDHAAFAAASTVGLGDSRRDWMNRFLSDRGCWSLLTTAYDNGLRYSQASPVEGPTPLDNAFSSENYEAVVRLLQAIEETDRMTKQEKDVSIIESFILYSPAEQRYVDLAATYGAFVWTPYPSGNHATKLHSLAKYGDVEALQRLLPQAAEKAPEGLLGSAVNGYSSLSDNTDAVVRTIEVLRANGYSPTQTVDIPLTGRVHRASPLEFARSKNVPEKVLAALQ